MAPHFCRWLWDAVTVLCDGTVTCGLDDPFKFRNYGNARNQSIKEILASQGVWERRHRLLSGQRCNDCSLYTQIDNHNIAQIAPTFPYPGKLVIETSIRCNIRCNISNCNVNNDATVRVRDRDLLDFDLFKKVVDEIGPHLRDLFFFNYGEPFINPRALDMLKYARAVNPGMRISSSTNGILLANKSLADRLVNEELVDWLCFTIGGVDQETYSQYHKAASFDKAIGGLRAITEAKRRYGKSKPITHWRYLMFRWNDSDAHVEQALRLKDEIEVDEFKFFLASNPIEGRSLRRAPSTSGFDAIQEWRDIDAHYRVDPFAEAGLYEPENNGMYAWTGRTAEVMVVPDAKGYVSLGLMRPTLPLVPKTKVELKTSWTHCDAVVGENVFHENRIAVPWGHPASGQPLPVEIVTTTPFIPVRYQLNKDSRELGVMVALDNVSPRPNPFRVNQVREVGPRLREGH